MELKNINVINNIANFGLTNLTTVDYFSPKIPTNQTIRFLNYNQ